MKLLVHFCSLFFLVSPMLSQTTKENNLIADGNDFHQDAAYAQSEASYRKALSINNNNIKAQHNLGNALYRSKDYKQANQHYFITQKNSGSKADKHLAFHNMGNGYMQQKDYGKAVEAYKNALRNNPTDDTTRYNYALAKELLEKEKQDDQQDQQNQQDKDNQDNQDSQNNQDGQENKDQKDKEKEGDQDDQSDNQGDKGDDKNQEKENKDEGDEKDNNKQDPNQEKKPKDKDNKNPQQSPQKPKRKPGQISPEQVKSLLDAMNQQEKKVQDKVNAKKAKGVPVKAKKDW